MLYSEMIAVYPDMHRSRGVSSFWVLNRVLKQPLDLKRANYDYFKNTRAPNENLSDVTRVRSLLTLPLSARSINAPQFMLPTAVRYW